MRTTTIECLALFLCMVISFVPPVIQPSNSWRMLVIITAVLLFVACSPTVDSNAQLTKGLSTLVVDLKALHRMVLEV